MATTTGRLFASVRLTNKEEHANDEPDKRQCIECTVSSKRRKVTVKSINMHAHVAALLATDVIADAIISVFTILLFKF